MRRILLLFLVCGLTAYPQASKKPATAWPIGTLSVQGNKIYTQEKLLEIAGLKVGQVAGKPEFDAARDRLLATGAFESVGYRFNPEATGSPRYAAVFEVAEVPQVFPYRFESLPGDPKLLAAEIRRQEPLFADKIPATEQVLARVSREVQNILAKAGFNEPVRAKLMAESKDNLQVVFQPSSMPVVAEVKFHGNDSIPLKTLQNAIAGAAIGAAYTEARFKEILNNGIRPLYEAQGRLRVSFPTIAAEPAKDVKGLIVDVGVKEGDVYKLTSVALTGPMAGSRTLLKEGGFKLEQAVDMTAVEEGLDKIRKSLRKSGYLDVKAAAERKIDDKEKTVELTIPVEPGPQYTFGKLTIEGLDIQTEPQVRKLWALKQGKPFDGGYPNFFLARLKEDNLFENLGDTKAAVKKDDKSRIVDVTLHFTSNGKPLPRIGPDAPGQPTAWP
jgi:outer membrane protein insertion porin family